MRFIHLARTVRRVTESSNLSNQLFSLSLTIKFIINFGDEHFRKQLHKPSHENKNKPAAGA